MKWGSFTPVHIASLIVAAGILVALYALLRKRSERVQTAVLGILSFSGIAAVIFNLVMWDSPLEYLPLHLCSLNALVLPIAVLTKNKILCNLLLLWSLGAAAALVVNTAQAEFAVMGSVFCFYFFPHVLEFGIPILLFRLGLVKKDPRCILSTMGITVLSYTAIHFANLGLNAYCAANRIMDGVGNPLRVNYMYSLTPENPVLALCWRILPCPYWYMFLILPVIAVYLLAVYAPGILAARKRSVQV